MATTGSSVGRGPRRGRRTQAERTEATTQELVATAHTLFAERGFVGTSIEDMVVAAGVTRGALYHHFTSKTDLFRAACALEMQRLAQVYVEAGARRRDPWKRLEVGCLAFVDACREPGVQQIVFLDSPAVLGWEGTRELQQQHVIALLEDGLREAISAGLLRPRPVEPLASLLFGAISEAGMVAARSPEIDAAALRAELKRVFKALTAA